MKKVIIVLFLLLITVYIYAQTPDWIWASQGGGSSIYGHISYDITLDDDGNSYVTGVFSGTANFGTATLTSSGIYDIFVAKLDTNGNWLWAVKAGGNSDDFGYGIAVDGYGNCFVTGYFSSTASFGSLSLTSTAYFDMFIAKLDTNGNWLWAIQAGGDSNDCGQGIKVDDNGNSYVTGYFGGLAYFGPYPLTSSGYEDLFVAMLDTNGSWLWATQAGGSSFDYGRGIAIDDYGNSYVTGTFVNTATFGSYSLTSSGYNDIFVAKMDTNGNWIWATKAGGNNYDYSHEIARDDDGNSYVTGAFYDTASFGSYSLTSSGAGDIFVAKVDSVGNWQWVTQAGGSTEDKGYGIAIDNYNNSYVTGYFNEPATFGSYTLTSDGIFLAKMDSVGTWLWADQAEGNYAYGIAIDNYFNNYVTGYFYGPANFGSHLLPSNGSADLFVAKYGIDYKADFSANIISGYLPLSVNFTDLSILLSPIIDWFWDFGDGNTSSSQNPSHEYLLPGIYSVSLTVIDSIDSTATEIKSDYITIYSPDPPAPPPDILVDIIYPDAFISWTAVDTTLSGDPCITDGYIVSYSEIPDDDYFWFLSFTTSTDYTHQDVAQYSSQMFYNVLSYVDLSREQIQYLNGLNDSHHKIRWLDVKDRLKKRSSLK